MAQNLLGKIFNKQPAAQETSVDSSTAARSSDGLTGVAKYLQDKQPPPQQTATAPETSSNQQAAEQTPTSVAKYVGNIKPAALTGVARYLVKQIIPEYQIRAAAAAKAAAPSGVEKYLAKVTAAAATQQPAVPSSVEKYLKKIG
ncbi:MAG: hypothetical protein V3V18_06040 [Methylococcales bacterium]